MPVIEVSVRNKIAVRTNNTVYVCGNSDYTVRFDFDSEWDAYATKTARFRYGGNTTDVLFRDNTCPVPPLWQARNLEVGVFAGDIHTTTPARIYTKQSITGIWGTPPDPEPSVYDQIMEAFNETGASVEQTDDGAVITVRYLGGETKAFVRHSEVYVGSGEMPEGYSVQVDPSGDRPSLRIRGNDGQYLDIPSIKGDKGEKGDRGETGPQGPQGEPAEGSVLSVNGVTPDGAGALTLSPGDMGAVPAAGGSMTGMLNMSGSRITAVAPPEADTDAANRQYVDSRCLIFADCTVDGDAWSADSTYENYGFSAVLPLPGVTDSMVPEVVLSPMDAQSGAFAPVVRSQSGGVRMYAASVPENPLTVPTVILWR